MSNPISFVREITVRSDTRAMMTNKTSIIKLRKYLSPEDAGNLIKEIILALHLGRCMAEFVFYLKKMSYSGLILRIATRNLLLLEKAADLPDSEDRIRTYILK
jgi:hypothetical protein